ncbi:mitochondrial fission ELM1 family protein [Cohaesibacter celericrescens]|uniref:mitochondrial fission ELM1 family protein n=1 Tax=Cohaesibacter celericrescens TaxID=2067669 RepID=UPI0015E09EBE|nr:mitochondrial fission ELM1 family protein [Cohaesibacter celericrescens]
MTADGERKIWLLSDGKAGDENQCLGVAERLGGDIEIRHVNPSKFWAMAMPWGPIPFADHPDRETSPLHGHFPDVAIASGRRAVSYLRTLKKASPQTLTVFLKDPRTNSLNADLIWVPFHDARRGKNVMATLTGPHRVTTEVLRHARTTGPQALHHLPGPSVSLILGGDTAKEQFGKAASRRLARYLSDVLPSHFSVMVTPSRRTPDHLMAAVRQALQGRPHWIWDGEGENPYFTMMALADAIIVTADSHSMLSDVLATSVPVYIFEPDAYPEKLKRTIDQLVQQPWVQRLDGPLETGDRAPIDATELIADEIRHLLKDT